MLDPAVAPMKCSQCEEVIAIECSAEPCPACGSLDRAVTAGDTGKLRELTRLKVRKGLLRQPELEIKAGDELRFSTGRWSKLERRVDRERDRYLEHIEDAETGEVIRHVEEPLSVHQGHGTAKPRTQTT
jgi:hypothetical protein